MTSVAEIIANETYFVSTEEIIVSNTEPNSNDLLFVLIAASVGLAVTMVACVLILKKYISDRKLKKEKTNTDTTPRIVVTNSEGGKQVANTQNSDTKSNVHKLSVASVSSRSSIPSRYSNSKFSDILPPTRPPPLGLKPVLSAEQKLNRPLPPTPPSENPIL